MKILLVHENLPPCSIIGPSIHVYLLASELSRRGHIVHVLTGNQCFITNDTVFGKYPKKEMKVFQLVPVLKGLTNLSYILLAGLYIRKLEKKEQYDVIHAHTSSAGFILFYKPKTYTVVTIHGVYSAWFETLKKNLSNHSKNFLRKVRMLLGGKFYSLMESAYCKRADHLIVLTQKEKKHLHDSYRVFNEEIISIIPNGIDIEELQLESKNMLYNTKLQESYALFVGRIAANKGIPQLLSAWKHYKEKGGEGRLIIAGKTAEMSNLAKKYSSNVQLQISIKENVPRDTLLTLYRQARIVIIPSLFEGLPFTLLDALALGKAIILSNRLELGSLIKDSVCYVDPLDIGQFSEQIDNLMNNLNFRQELQKRALKIAKDHFSVEAMTDEIEKVYSITD